MRYGKLIVLIMAALAVLASCGKGGSANIGGTEYPLDAQSLDLSGQTLEDIDVLSEFESLELLNVEDTGITPEQYQAIQEAVPECKIVWSVPLRGEYLNNYDTTELSLDGFTEEDARTLPLFLNLESVTVKGCNQLLLDHMAQELPYDITYTMSVGGVEYGSDTVGSITVTDPDVQELKDSLPYLTGVQEVALTGALPDDAQLLELKQACPDIDFLWDFTVYGVETNSMATELTLDNIRIRDTQELEDKLPLFNQLEVVNMNYCGLSDDTMDELRNRHPEVKIVWTIELNAGNTIRSDATYFITAKMKNRSIYDHVLYKLRYCTDLICVDLGHQQVTDMSFLEYLPNLQYLILADTPVKDISFVSNLKELKYLEIFISDVRDYWPLVSCTNLEYLNIGYTAYEDITALSQLTWLDHLWAGTSGLSDEERQYLCDSLPDTHVTFFHDSSTSYGWRHSPGYFEMRDLMGMSYMTR